MAAHSGVMCVKRVSACAALAFSLLSSLSVWAQEPVEVRILGYQFHPAEVHIRVGEAVIWQNQEKRTSHSVVFSSRPEEASERLFPGESWQRRFDAPGVYPYHCEPHPEMMGVVIVAAP